MSATDFVLGTCELSDGTGQSGGASSNIHLADKDLVGVGRSVKMLSASPLFN